MKGQIKVGTYTGTGAAINIELGFVPDCVITVNYTDGNAIGVWTSDMTDDTAVDIAAAVAPNAAGGITPFDGTRATTGKGFTAGADYSVSAKVYTYIAIANQ